MKNTTQIGNLGEEQAIKYLIEKHYEIITTNYKTRYGEIDIIAKDGEFLVFVEVKKRKNQNFADTADFIDYKKRQRIIKTASLFLMDNDYDLQPRFDAVLIYKNTLNHLESAFECD